MDGFSSCERGYCALKMVFSPWIKRGVWKTVCEWLQTEITEVKS